MGSYCALSGARYFAFLYSDMGCTSSAPNSAASPPPLPLVETSATDTTVDFEQNRTGDIDMETKEYRQKLVGGVTETAEVPVANIVDKVEVDRTTAPSKVSDLTKEDIPATAEISQSQCNEIETVKIEYQKDQLDTEERLSRLEEVVEKVVELYVTENHSTVNNLQENANDQSKFVTNEIDKDMGNFENEMKDKNEEIPATGSPSSLNGSEAGARALGTATRWEALADIAAELPPSLAVDPLTGQIYALSK